MPLSIEHNPREGFLRVTIEGPWPSAIEQAQVRARLLQEGVLTLNTCVLLDLRGVTPTPTPEEIQSAIATAVAQETGRVRRALLVTPHQYETVLALKEMGGYEGAPIRLFKDESAAIRWLTAHRHVAVAISPQRSQTEAL